MIRVYVKKQANYLVSTPKLKKRLRNFIEKQGIVSDALVSIALVGEKRMLDLSKAYLNDNKVHDVLTFADEDRRGKFVYPPNGKIHLGEIVVCYPKAFYEAKSEGKRIDEKVIELVEHGALHLMGVHHE